MTHYDPIRESMPDIAIRVENLSKLYHIGRTQQRHDALEAVFSSQSSVFSRQAAVFSSQSSVLSRQSHPGTDNCELKTDNSGAGSTLLKILSRITEPTSGRAEIHGRGGSLLEVGAGSQSNPELTGRENIRYA